MERYNPPQTSEQSYCFGCARQIRKVQEMMDCLYMEKMHSRIQKAKFEDVIEKLEDQLELQRRLHPVNQGEESSEGSSQEDTNPCKMKALQDLNKHLVELLTKKSEIPESHPLEEWKDAINLKWEEQYDKLHKTALGIANRKEKLEEVTLEQEYKIHELKMEIAELKKKLEKKDEELDKLTEV